jgi:dTDP-4-dehydrorhamnose 3,5-epimerase
MDATPMRADTPTFLPVGARLITLKTHPDLRGDLTEIFRNEWHESPLPVQWIASRCAANALQGMHVHASRWNYLCIVAGEMVVGLHDLRPAEASLRRSAMLRADRSQLQMLVVPPGVAHGFYAPVDAMLLVASSGCSDPIDHHRCRWDSPELGLNWPCAAPDLSPVDRDAGSYADGRAALLAAMTPRAARR